MPIISHRIDYNGFLTKVSRLGLAPAIEEAESTITSFHLLIEETKHANGTRGIRQTIDAAFALISGWTKITSGGIDWGKKEGDGRSVGVEVQVSGRSDMVAIDVMHLSRSLKEGAIDIGIIIVPNDTLSRFLTDRTPNLSTAIKHVKIWAEDLPIRIVAFGHDGVGEALVKMRTNLGKNRD